MKRTIITTKDGSKTIHLPDWNENYHSHHGAFQEAMHVFIEMGLREQHKSQKEISILEVGFGTGLNAILTYAEVADSEIQINYSSIEAFPVSSEEIEMLDYGSFPSISSHKNVYEKMHEVEWNEMQEITSNFSLLKHETTLQDFIANNSQPVYDLIYFDAFGPRVQPDLWNKEIFEGMFNCLKSNGILVTYCAKGQVRRDLQEVGFLVEKLPGPPGKREMLRGVKRK